MDVNHIVGLIRFDLNFPLVIAKISSRILACGAVPILIMFILSVLYAKHLQLL